MSSPTATTASTKATTMLFSSSSSTSPSNSQKFGLQHFAKNRLLSLHDACVSVTSAPKQSKIEKSFEKYKSSSRNRRNWLSSIIAPSSAGYGRYIVDPTKKFNSQNQNHMLNYSNSADLMDPNSEFLTAINNNRKSTSMMMKRMKMAKEYEDLPRHVPRHVVQPLQDAPHSPSSPIANFSLIPLFALCRNHDAIVLRNSSQNISNESENDIGKKCVLLSPKKSFPEWCPSVEISSQSDASTVIINPRHVLPKKIKPVNTTRQDSDSSVLISENFEENFIEMKFVVGNDENSNSTSNNNDNANNINNDNIYISFLQLALPLPSSLLSVILFQQAHENKNQSSSIPVTFWTQKFLKARLLRTSSPSFFNLQEIGGLWWYFVWMHRNYSIHWLLDINHLFSSTSSSTSSSAFSSMMNNNNDVQTQEEVKAKIKAKRKFFLPSPDHEQDGKSISKIKSTQDENARNDVAEIKVSSKNLEMDEKMKNNNDNNKNDAKSAQVLSQLLTTFTTRAIRDADNFGQRESRKKSRYEKYDIGGRRRKGKKMKKTSSIIKRRLQLKQQMDHQRCKKAESSSQHQSDNDNKINQSSIKKFSSAQEYILHRLAVKFSLLKPHQLRTLVDHYRLFLHHCNVACSNEKRLWRETDAAAASKIQDRVTKKTKHNKNAKTQNNEAVVIEQCALLNHSSIQLPQEVYLEELKVWREWRFVYSFFPIFALKAAMFGSSLPLKKMSPNAISSDENNNNNNNDRKKNSSSLGKILGFDFVISESENNSNNKKQLKKVEADGKNEISDLVSLPSSESCVNAFERLSASNVMTSGIHPSLKNSTSSANAVASHFLLDPKSILKKKSYLAKNKLSSSVIKYHLSTELSKLELALLKTRSGYWVFRNSLPAIDPQNWWKHFVVSTTTCAQKWDTLTGQQRTLFDTLPMKRKSGEKRSDPFFMFLRTRVAEASALRKAQIETRKKEKANARKQQQQRENDVGGGGGEEDNEDETKDFEKFPFLSTETNLPTTLGRVCALARKDWNNMHPFEQAQYYDQDSIKQSFPDFEGFKKEDAALWKSLVEEEEQRQKMLDQMELEQRWSLHDNFYSDDYFHNNNNKNNSENGDSKFSSTSSSLLMRLKNDEQIAASSSIMIASTSGGNNSNNNNGRRR